MRKQNFQYGFKERKDVYKRQEFIMMLNKDIQNIEVLTDYNPISTIKLSKLCPEWWLSNSFLKF